MMARPPVSVCVSDADEWHPLIYWEQVPQGGLRAWAWHNKQRAYYSKLWGKSHAWQHEPHGPVGVFFNGSWLKLKTGKPVPRVVLKTWPRPSCDVATKPEVCEMNEDEIVRWDGTLVRSEALSAKDAMVLDVGGRLDWLEAEANDAAKRAVDNAVDIEDLKQEIGDNAEEIKDLQDRTRVLEVVATASRRRQEAAPVVLVRAAEMAHEAEKRSMGYALRSSLLVSLLVGCVVALRLDLAMGAGTFGAASLLSVAALYGLRSVLLWQTRCKLDEVLEDEGAVRYRSQGVQVEA